MEAEQILKLIEMVGGIGVNLFLLIAFAAIVEGITEFAAAPWFEVNPWLRQNKHLLPFVPIPFGLIGALLYKFDILFELSNIVGGEIELTFYGMVLTGVLIARGSNFLHQYTERWFPAKRG